jgi:hypothetical protein
MENKSVSPNNPCPFLRAAVRLGLIREQHEPLGQISKKLSRASVEGGPIPRAGLFFVALIANGLRPGRLLKSLFRGVDVGSLRNGPLDKRGVGSRILSVDGEFDAAEFTRLESFAEDVVHPTTGIREKGLKLAKIVEFMDANFARSEGSRRKVDRALMNGEWPVLLRVMGHGSEQDRYLSLRELRELFSNTTLPNEVVNRLR